MGRGPEEIKGYVIDDMVLVRLRGVLTAAEKQRIKSDEGSRGRSLLKQVRIELLEKGRGLLEQILLEITGKRMKNLHTDISTLEGERVIIFTLDGCPLLKDADK